MPSEMRLTNLEHQLLTDAQAIETAVATAKEQLTSLPPTWSSNQYFFRLDFGFADSAEIWWLMPL